MKNRVADLRRDRAITQDQLAAAIAVTRQTISSIENGRYNPSIVLAFKLSRFLGVSIEELFIFEEENHGIGS